MKLCFMNNFFTLTISKGIATGNWTFFPVNNSPQGSSGLISNVFHYVFKFLSVPGQLSLEVTNMPGTAKFMGLSLTRFCFF